MGKSKTMKNYKDATIDDPLTALEEIERLAKIAVSTEELPEEEGKQLLKATTLMHTHFKLSLRQSYTPQLTTAREQNAKTKSNNICTSYTTPKKQSSNQLITNTQKQ